MDAISCESSILAGALARALNFLQPLQQQQHDVLRSASVTCSFNALAQYVQAACQCMVQR
jgi:hypothetical protein